MPMTPNYVIIRSSTRFHDERPPCVEAVLLEKPKDDDDWRGYTWGIYFEPSLLPAFLDRYGKLVMHTDTWGTWGETDTAALAAMPVIEIYDGYRE